MRLHAIVLAGGSGDRFGAEIPKQFVRLAGEEILLRSLRTVAAAGVEDVVVVSHPDWLHETERVVAAAGLSVPTSIVAGGATRNESTRNGLQHLDAAPDDVIVVHDAVRPLVPLEVVRRAIEPVASGEADATDTVIPSADTLVIVEGDLVVHIPERGRYRRGQTPQVFRQDVLARAYAAAAAVGDLTATDDCSLVLRHIPGVRILAVPGDEVNLKITTRIDMVIADRMIQMRTLSGEAEPEPTRSLAGARVYVVGGTSGIGRAIAEKATEMGAKVATDGRRTGLDVRDYGAVEARVSEVAAELGGIDHVLCTVGVLRTGAAVESSPDELAEVVHVNVVGTLNVARATHPYLRRSQGSFTAFASSSFTLGRANYVAYSASKAAVVNLAQGLAAEWADDRVRVNAVSPERTDTEMRRVAFPNESMAGLLQPSDVAEATLRLILSDLTGQVLDVRRHDTVVAVPNDRGAAGADGRVAGGEPAPAGRAPLEAHRT